MTEIETTAAETTKRTRKTTPIAKYPEIPTRIIAIDGQYTRDFFKDKAAKGEISKEELQEWAKLTRTLIEEKGERAYFQAFRQEFVKAFFPALLEASKQKAKRESMADFLEGLM